MTVARYVRLLAPLSAALAVAACGAASQGPIVIPDTPAASSASSAVSTAQVAPKAAVRGMPVAVDIPAIGVAARDLITTGLNKDGSPSTPPTSKPQQIGVYGYGAAPCSTGPAKVPFVLIGHIDGDKQRGVFYDLKSLKAGDTVTVKLDTGASCTYRINKLASFDKEALAKGTDAVGAKEIWGPVPQGSIRVISCGGKFVGAPLYYASNIVATGTLVP